MSLTTEQSHQTKLAFESNSLYIFKLGLQFMYLFVCLLGLGIQSRDLCIQGMCSTTKLYLSPCFGGQGLNVVLNLRFSCLRHCAWLYIHFELLILVLKMYSKKLEVIHKELLKMIVFINAESQFCLLINTETSFKVPNKGIGK